MIRPERRSVVVGVALIGAVLAAWGGMLVVLSGGWWGIYLGIAGAAAQLIWMAFARAVVYDDRIVVRNYRRTVTVRRAEIARVEVNRVGLGALGVRELAISTATRRVAVDASRGFRFLERDLPERSQALIDGWLAL